MFLFLKDVRKICNQHNIILIFDECTTGFRRCNGGMHLLTNVEPDILMLGKALGNGYAITAVIGKKVKKAEEKALLVALFGQKELDLWQQNRTLEIFDKKPLKQNVNG